jgi:hypothetical protein
MTEETLYVLTVECKYALPTDTQVRQQLYGAIDPEECVRIDLENDPAMVLLETEFHLVSVVEGNQQPGGDDRG